ncbi:hypothetical protein ACLOJK_016084 [Asimina triloba]
MKTAGSNELWTAFSCMSRASQPRGCLPSAYLSHSPSRLITCTAGFTLSIRCVAPLATIKNSESALLLPLTHAPPCRHANTAGNVIEERQTRDSNIKLPFRLVI